MCKQTGRRNTGRQLVTPENKAYAEQNLEYNSALKTTLEPAADQRLAIADPCSCARMHQIEAIILRGV